MIVWTGNPNHSRKKKPNRGAGDQSGRRGGKKIHLPPLPKGVLINIILIEASTAKNWAERAMLACLFRQAVRHRPRSTAGPLGIESAEKAGGKTDDFFFPATGNVGGLDGLRALLAAIA